MQLLNLCIANQYLPKLTAIAQSVRYLPGTTALRYHGSALKVFVSIEIDIDLN